VANQAHCKFQLNSYSIGTASLQWTVVPLLQERIHLVTLPDSPQPAGPEQSVRSEHSRLPPVRLDGKIAIIEMSKIAIHNGITHTFSFNLMIHLLFYMSTFIPKALSRMPSRMLLQLPKKYIYHISNKDVKKIGKFF
jgi:hypothetical protein